MPAGMKKRRGGSHRSSVGLLDLPGREAAFSIQLSRFDLHPARVYSPDARAPDHDLGPEREHMGRARLRGTGLSSVATTERTPRGEFTAIARPGLPAWLETSGPSFEHETHEPERPDSSPITHSGSLAVVVKVSPAPKQPDIPHPASYRPERSASSSATSSEPPAPTSSRRPSTSVRSARDDASSEPNPRRSSSRSTNEGV